ncbi:MAG: cation transporter [Vicinamibacterales bacterium]
MTSLPHELRAQLDHGARLEWWTLFWQATIIVAIFFVMGSSQAMKSAWVEDMLGLAPATCFLIARRLERRPPSRRFPFGFARANGLAFLVSATVLVALGGYLIWDSGRSLIAAEHPTIGPIFIGGTEVWLGWVMIATLVYSAVPPMLLGRRKLPVAAAIQDQVLHTDALMQKADWSTAVAGIAGIIGVGLGFWWADSVAALLIAFDISRDGLRALRIATAELLDGAPRALEKDVIAEDAAALEGRLAERFPGAGIRTRATGRFILAQVDGAAHRGDTSPESLWPGPPERRWRLRQVSFTGEP